ncbi:carboxylesterase family protein [Nocardia sp. NPDC101769]|uniref:carboxylesterase family protein n=1 Tax=Nocardia sp. NPDC101769 TaxID=3364333 RepID=UPI003827B121
MIVKAPPVAETRCGTLQGQWNDEVAAFRGVPYAAPPVGPLRFAPPAAAVPWSGARATGEGAFEAEYVGEMAWGVPAFAGYAVAARDLDATRALLDANGVPTRQSAGGDLFVPGVAALGAVVAFRQG